jgi:hypothetical protein
MKANQRVPAPRRRRTHSFGSTWRRSAFTGLHIRGRTYCAGALTRRSFEVTNLLVNPVWTAAARVFAGWPELMSFRNPGPRFELRSDSQDNASGEPA